MEAASGRGTAAEAQLLPASRARAGDACQGCSEREGVTGVRAWEGKHTHTYKYMCAIGVKPPPPAPAPRQTEPPPAERWLRGDVGTHVVCEMGIAACSRWGGTGWRSPVLVSFALWLSVTRVMGSVRLLRLWACSGRERGMGGRGARCLGLRAAVLGALPDCSAAVGSVVSPPS